MAPGSTAVLQGENVLTNSLAGLGEVVSRAVGNVDPARGDLDAVDIDNAVGVWHVQSVVQNGQGFLVDKSTQVPVDVVGLGVEVSKNSSKDAQAVLASMIGVAWSNGTEIIREIQAGSSVSV